MTLPVLASSAVNSSGSPVSAATLTRPTATGGAAVGDLLMGILNVENTANALVTGAAFAEKFPIGAITQTYVDGVLHVGYRRATGSDPSSWSVAIATASAYQALVLAYRNAPWVQDRSYRSNAASGTINGVVDLKAHGPNFDVLPIHIIGMDQEAARTLTPGAGHTSVLDNTEATTLLRATVLHGVEIDTDVLPLPAINSTLSVAEAHAIVAYSLAGVAFPSGLVVADGLALPHSVVEPFPISENVNIVGDPPIGGEGASIPTEGQLWPRGV
jgi:hypothetical protein